MTRLPRHDTPMLRTLERHRNNTLHEARAVLVAAEAALSRADAACVAAERRLESALSVQRSLSTGGAALTAHQLRQAHQYVHSQAAALAELQRARARDRRTVANARAEVSMRLREVKTIERLRERLRISQAKWRLRRHQLRLDALGIIRSGTSEATWPSAASES